MLNKYIKFILPLLITFNLFGADYYWVGGTGNWSDFTNHWATTSGGTVFYSNSPTLADDVFFDTNSSINFNDTIFIDVNASCNNITLDDFNKVKQLANFTVFGKFDLVQGEFYCNGNGLNINQFYSDYNYFRTFDISNSSINLTGFDTIWTIEGTSLTFNQTASSINLTYSGNNLVVFEAGGSMITYDNVNCLVKQLEFISSSNFNTLTLSPGLRLLLPSRTTYGTLLTLTANTINAIGNCVLPIIIEGVPVNSSTPQTTININGNILNTDFTRIKNINATNGTYIATNSIDLGNNTSWTITEDPSNVTVTWINGTGNWSDPTHWSTACVPGPNNSVLFDAASFSAIGQTVNVDVEAYCDNMTWTGVNNPIFIGTTNNIYIKGSLTFDANMTTTFSENYYFNSVVATGQTITTNGVTVNGNFIFNSTTDSYDFTDNITSNKSIFLEEATITSINKIMSINAFLSSSSTTRSLDISNSTITLTGTDSTWIINPTTFTFTAVGSEIIVNHALANTSIVKGGGQTYNTFRFLNIDSRLYDANIFSILEIGTNSSLAMESGVTQTMDSLIANGSCTQMITLESTDNYGSPANINKTGYDTLIVSNLNLWNVTANATAPKYNLAQNSITNYNTTGWDTTDIGIGSDFYWVNGSGMWSDVTHWETPLGTPAVCLPTIRDTVYFNAVSFLLMNDSVLVNSNAYCAKMDWTGSDIWNPKLHLIKNLNCAQNAILNPTLQIDNSNANAEIKFLPKGNNSVFTTFNASINANITLSGLNLTDSLILNGNLNIDTTLSLTIASGTFDSNSDSISVGTFISVGTLSNLILLNASVVRIAYELDFTTLTTLISGTSDITLSSGIGGGFFKGAGLTYNNVTFESTVSDTATMVFDANIFNDLTLIKGLKIRLEDGLTQSVNGNFNALGTCVDSIFIQSHSNGITASINLTAIGNGECLSSQDINVVTSNLNTLFSNNKSNNTGLWNFDTSPHSIAQLTTPYEQCLGNTTAFTNTSTSYSGGLTGLTFEWDFGDGTTSAATNPTTTYATAEKFFVTLTTTYTNQCTDTYLDSVNINNPVAQLTSSDIDTTICATESVTLSAVSSPPADTYDFIINGTSVQNLATQTYITTALNNGDIVTLNTTLNGCTTTSSDQLTFIVNPLPNVILTSSDADDIICDGDNVTFTATGADVYQFYIDGIAQTAYTTTNTFSTITLTNGQVVSVDGKDTITNCSKNGNVTITTTVNPNPVPLMANSDADNVICDGVGVTFTGSAATNFEFFVNGTSVQGPTTTATYNTTTLVNGDVITMIGYTLGCGTLSTNDYTFIVNPIPNVTLTNSTGTMICENDQVNFSANGATAYEFWIGGLVVQGPSGLPTYSISSITNGQDVYVVGSANNCFDTSTVQTFTVNALPIPVLTSSDADTIICQYENVTFTASGASTYQYLLDGFPIGPFTTSTTYPTDSLNNGQTVSVIGEQNGCTNPSTNAFTFTVKPSFNVNLFSSDADLTICEGESIDFTGVAGTGTITFDLFVNNILESSNTTGNFSLTTLTAGTQLVSLSATKNGCTYFANDTLSILIKPIPVVTMTSSDADNIICAGDSILFVASGATTYDFLIDGIAQGNSAQDSLYINTLTNGQTVSVNGYTNGCFDVSNSFSITVNPIPNVTLSSDDIDNIICEGTTITFTAAGAINYEFFMDGVSQGAASTTSTLVNNTLNSNTLIEVIGSSNGCSSNGNSINLIVNANPIISASISDSDTTICSGESVSFVGSGASTYQLLLNGTPTNGPSTQNIYNLTSLNNGDIISIQGFSVNGCFSTSTDVFTFTVNPNPTVTMTSSDADSVICVNDVVTFNASGANTYTYFVDGQMAFNGATYVTDSIQNGQIISVIGDLNGCTASTNPIPFTVYLYPITALTTADNDSTICVGDSIIFAGLGAFDYEFFVNGNSVQGPTTSDSLYSTTLNNGDIITVLGINNGCGTLSNAIPVTVISYPTTTLTSSDANNTICYGESVTFTANGANDYEFYINSNLQGSLSATSTFISTILNDNDSIWVIGYNGECLTNAPQSFVMTVSTLPLTLTSTGNNLICSGDAVTYNSSGADSYEFFVDGVSVQGPSTNTTYTSSTITNGQVVTVNGFSTTTGCTQLAQTSHLVTVMTLPIISALNSTTICEGDSTVLVSSSPTWNQWYYNTNSLIGETDTGYVAYLGGDFYTEITLGGNGNVLAVGNNAFGQFGDSTTISDVFKVDTKNIQNITQVESGQNYNIALEATGIVYTWGKNDFGQIGDGTFTSQIVPYATNISNATQVSAGHQFSLVVLTTGEVMSWGKNDVGQLGQGNNNTTNFPFLIPGLTNISSVMGGQNHAMALLTDGTVMAWGDNQYGQLGIGNFINQNTPQLITNLSGIASIHSGANHSMAIDSLGNLYVWGQNAEGQLGLNGVQYSNIPVLHSLSNLRTVDGGLTHTLALTNSDQLYSWGNNVYAQLGNGTNNNSITPILVSSLDAVKTISTNFNHNFAIKNDNSVWSWGINTGGQLANENNVTQNLPVHISSLTGTTDMGIGENHTVFLAGFSNSCPSNIITVTVNPSPDAIVSYNNGVLSVSPIGTAFQWYVDGILIPGANSSAFVPNTPGYYSCEVSFIGGCMSLSNEYPYKIIGFEENETLNLSIYPNPTNGQFTLKGNFDLYDNIQITIYNAFGQVVQQNSLGKNQTELNIDLTHMANGIYLIRINSEDQNIRYYKVIVAH